MSILTEPHNCRAPQSRRSEQPAPLRLGNAPVTWQQSRPQRSPWARSPALHTKLHTKLCTKLPEGLTGLGSGVGPSAIHSALPNPLVKDALGRGRREGTRCHSRPTVLLSSPAALPPVLQVAEPMDSALLACRKQWRPCFSGSKPAQLFALPLCLSANRLSLSTAFLSRTFFTMCKKKKSEIKLRKTKQVETLSV